MSQTARRAERPVLMVVPTREERVDPARLTLVKGLGGMLLLSPLYFGGNDPLIVLHQAASKLRPRRRTSFHSNSVSINTY